MVEVGGVPIIERVARALVGAGADRLIVNTHHLGEVVERYARERDGWGAELRFSREEGRAPLETGGGLLHARGHFRQDAPFFLHNADLLTDLPLKEMYDAHLVSGALATLAVMERPSSRHFLFDDRGLLGRSDDEKGLDLRIRPAEGEIEKLAFAGVHVVSPEIFPRITERGAFSILDPYLRLAGEGERIVPFRVDGALWIDIGRPEMLEQARALFAGKAKR